MKLADTNYDNSETGCCARFDGSKWDGKRFSWDNKLFLRDQIREFLHIPLNFDTVIARDRALIEDAQAFPEEPLWLTDELSPWKAEILMAVDCDIPGANIEKISGTYFIKTFEGPYRMVETMMADMVNHISVKGRVPLKIYTYYPTCPKCAKHFGTRDVVLFANVE